MEFKYVSIMGLIHMKKILAEFVVNRLFTLSTATFTYIRVV